MKRENIYFLLVLILVLVVVWVVYHLGSIPPEIDVDPLEAYVVVPDGDTFSNGTVHSGPGPLKMHAVVKFRDRKGEDWYAADVSSLRINGNDIPPDKIRRWTDRKIHARMLYFSVEPELSYYYIESPDSLPEIEFKHFFLAGGEEMWTCTTRRRGENYKSFQGPPVGEWAGEALQMGTMRLRVSVQFYHERQPMSSVVTVASTGKEEIDRVTTMVAGLGKQESALYTLSSYANLPGMGFAPDMTKSIRGSVRELLEKRWAYGTVLWLDMLPGKLTTYDVVYTGDSLVKKGKPVRWDQDARPGDALALLKGAIVLLQDDGDGFVSSGDRILVKVKGPLCACVLSDILTDRTALTLVRAQHEPSR